MDRVVQDIPELRKILDEQREELRKQFAVVFNASQQLRHIHVSIDRCVL
jgi:hypothetical protein